MECKKRRVEQKKNLSEHGHNRNSVALGGKEKRRLLQLVVCLALFLAAFLSRGTERLILLREELADAIYGNMDAQTVFTDLGWSLAARRPLGETLDTLWNGLFAPEEATLVMGTQSGPLRDADLAVMGRGEFNMMTSAQSEQEPTDPMVHSGAAPIPTPTPEPEVIHVDYTGPALPDNVTMDRYALGLSNTVTPVLGPLASGFGWREHPIEGTQKFHRGVDLGANVGTAVGAFADGVVEYIGESDIYGKYLQLRHEHGVTTFYCHCSRLLVQQGQTVTAGQTVAEVGATGRVTGPHLHFEIRRNDVLLQPLYYIETAS